MMVHEEHMKVPWSIRSTCSTWIAWVQQLEQEHIKAGRAHCPNKQVLLQVIAAIQQSNKYTAVLCACNPELWQVPTAGDACRNATQAMPGTAPSGQTSVVPALSCTSCSLRQQQCQQWQRAQHPATQTCPPSMGKVANHYGCPASLHTLSSSLYPGRSHHLHLGSPLKPHAVC
jgi:hypothetical protein